MVEEDSRTQEVTFLKAKLPCALTNTHTHRHTIPMGTLTNTSLEQAL